MTDNHYEFTGETKETFVGTLHRIRAARDIPQHGVREGDLGGWLGENATLTGDAWVTSNAWVTGNATVTGDALVTGEARVTGDAWVSGNAEVTGCTVVSGKAAVTGYAVVTGKALVTGDARIADYAVVTGEAAVTGYAMVKERALVTGKAWVSGYAVVTGEARVENRQDILTISPIGSESMSATAHPNRDGTHTLSVGCWTGDADGLASEVRKRSEKWQGTEEDHERWLAEYAALEVLVRARTTAWNKETNND